jgi:NifU-like protein involved in Fe-S cluster formation
MAKFVTVLSAEDGTYNVVGCHSTQASAEAACDGYNGSDVAPLEEMTILESDQAISAGSIVRSNGKGFVEESVTAA